MFRNIVGACAILALAFAVTASAQGPKSGKIIGEIKTMKDSKDGKNTHIDVLAPGEEKARAYFVQWDPKIKAPMPDVLKLVRAAKVGDRVELEWVGTNHGPAITAFKVLKSKDK
ncbi:MAG TPA: hypothetical protein VFE62_28345 [Gemmataceae bacterium]|nr:hypothetical protein [Gemmataceae bacterium]